MVLPNTMEDITERKESSIYNILVDPSTLPHFLSLIVNSSFIYLIMKSDIGGLGDKGSSIFLSLTIGYCLAALIVSKEYGKRIFKISNDDKGIFNREYWILSLKSLLPIFIISGILCSLIVVSIEGKSISYFMSLLFLLMSIGQGISLVSGGALFIDKGGLKEKGSRNSEYSIAMRVLVLVIIFMPLIWWFGYGASNVSDKNIMTHLWWIIFTLLIVIICYSLDKYTSQMRHDLESRGRMGDRLMTLMVMAASWHLLSAWRRNPALVDSTDGLMMLEEGVLMAITIILAVSTMVKKGQKRGFAIFEGQSSLFWGVAFGYAYGGSISSLTILSEQFNQSSLLQTTAIGHLLTVFAILVILPNAIRRLDTEELEAA